MWIGRLGLVKVIVESMKYFTASARKNSFYQLFQIINIIFITRILWFDKCTYNKDKCMNHAAW